MGFAMATAAKTVYPHIVKVRGYCGGKATIDDTRVRVIDVVVLHKEGASPAEILLDYPDLTLAQVHAALTYFYDHPGEIEATLALDEQAEEDHERARAQHLGRAR